MFTRRAAMAKVASAANPTTHASKRRDEAVLVSVMSASYQSILGNRSRSFGVPDRGVTAGAFESLRLAVHHIAVDGGGDVLVAVPAGVFRDLVIELRDFDGVGIPAGGEVKRMPESVVRLHRVLSENVVWSVTIV